MKYQNEGISLQVTTFRVQISLFWIYNFNFEYNNLLRTLFVPIQKNNRWPLYLVYKIGASPQAMHDKLRDLELNG